MFTRSLHLENGSQSKIKAFISYFFTNGVTSTLYLLFGKKNRHLRKGYNREDDPFTRTPDKKLFASNARESDWKHLHPKVFIAQNKEIYFISDKNFIPPFLRDAIHLKSVLQLTSAEIKSSVFYVYFTFDSDALPELKRIVENGGKFIPNLEWSKTFYRFVDKSCYTALVKTWSKKQRISHLNILVHENICEAISITRELSGDYLEIGVYKGGTLLTAINYLSEISQYTKTQRKVVGLDTFDGFNYSQARQSNDMIWSGFSSFLSKSEAMNYVKFTLANEVVDFEIHALNICSDQIPSSVKSISVAYIDVDMYEAFRDSLIAVHPLLQKGGIIICEDPAATPALYGAYLAMQEFLESSVGSQYVKIFKSGSYFLLKKF